MERLSERLSNVIEDCVKAWSQIQEEVVKAAISRLARYEDLEEQGRLVELPCRAGDMVWIPGHRFPAVIDEIVINVQDGITFNWSEHEESPEITELWDDGWFTPDDIGKTVFLTKEEAEAALAKEGE